MKVSLSFSTLTFLTFNAEAGKIWNVSKYWVCLATRLYMGEKCCYVITLHN